MQICMPFRTDEFWKWDNGISIDPWEGIVLFFMQKVGYALNGRCRVERGCKNVWKDRNGQEKGQLFLEPLELSLRGKFKKFQVLVSLNYWYLVK